MKNLYTIGEKDNLLIGWQNNHDFKDKEGGAPSQGEVFMNLFTEPWMAMQYLHENLNNHSAGLYKIDSPEAWDYYKGFAIEAMGAGRAIINLCDISKTHNDLQLNILPIKVSVSDFQSFLEESQKVETCSTCYSQDRFIKKEDNGTKVSIFTFNKP
ncbi:MAG: hypothetical protein COT80_02350 [Candidatus Buchananbacteria bacterium CG10_big_fil_rev_8_21_14_0_10_33_19]|uniref:Uncharacterized protein n=1 Tax=Candidatus Buchananbacteria bacterium CG10_big_fil_rev_8_21_14_0_10_33_19 TaxID=1974525 RepID=A0A2H0W452_9BACT|nr:MAG: hypothetical protein COT80_02350 [Candidatus Buchananbacteria bacterium CG10_big_fil_rev_8_21_14_0_10_33_19]